MKKNKKIMAAALVATALAVCMLAGCSSGGSDSAASSDEKDTIRIGTSSVCVDLANSGVATLEEMGYKVDVTVFDDYFLPNESLIEGTTDVNLYQHTPFLENYNAENGTDIEMLQPLLWEYYVGIYSVKADSIEDLPDGGIVGIADDASNIDHDLRLLDEAGLITLTDEEKELYDVADIVDNPHNWDFREADHNKYKNMDDYTFILGTSNTMASFGVDPTQHILMKFSESEYAHGMCILPENDDTQWAKDVMAAYTSDAAKAYITPDMGFDAAF